jgi:raffinose/stachyose/melibiose transport system substrate-binding protein
MKKLIVFILLVSICTGLTFAGGSAESAGIVMMQNKPEIDAALQAYGALWSENSGVEITIKSIGGGSGASMGQQLRADYAAGELPDIFAIDGIESYREWENVILDLSNEQWVNDTAVAFTVDGKVYGFPVAIEGWGMAYNADMLQTAGINPASLVNYNAYKEAFAQLNTMKAKLGIDSVVSMAASADMGWVTAHHNFNSLLSNGLAYGDLSVVNALLAGNVDSRRLSEYADWVALLFEYADQGVLTTGNYDAQVGAFAAGKSVFLHQGNWVDPNLAGANITFTAAFAPHGSQTDNTDGIFVAAPSFYVINKDSANVEAAKQFLHDLVYTQEGNNYMVNEAGSIPAFGNITLNPSGQLSQSVQAWSAEGKVYSWSQYYFSGDFRDQTLAPIYNRFATGQIDKQEFMRLLTEAFQNRT